MNRRKDKSRGNSLKSKITSALIIDRSSAEAPQREQGLTCAVGVFSAATEDLCNTWKPCYTLRGTDTTPQPAPPVIQHRIKNNSIYFLLSNLCGFHVQP